MVIPVTIALWSVPILLPVYPDVMIPNRSVVQFPNTVGSCWAGTFRTPAPYEDTLSTAVVDADAQSNGPDAYIPTWNLPLRIPVLGVPTTPACLHTPLDDAPPALYKKNDAFTVGDAVIWSAPTRRCGVNTELTGYDHNGPPSVMFSKLVAMANPFDSQLGDPVPAAN